MLPGASLGGAPGAAVSPPVKLPIPDSLAESGWVVALQSNPYFTAGFGLVGVGALMSALRMSAGSLQQVCRRRLLVSLEIPSSDYSYQWVMQWLVAQRAQNASRSLGGANWHHRGVTTTYSKDSAGRVNATFDFIPSPGRHWMHLGGANFLLVERERETKMVDLNTGNPWETLTLTTPSFPFGPALFGRILNEAKEMALAKEEGKTVVYHGAGHEWRPFGNPKQIRPYTSVILDGTTAELVADDVAGFLHSQQWYLDRGIPYRRGYLLHGPPGCGKSSYVLALAGKLMYNICMLHLGDPAMSDDRLQHLLAVVPPRSLVLIEDIDQATTIPTEATEGPYAGLSRVTFSGLLNALDGVSATEERLVFMTTNRYTTLPPALIRPGRVDLRVYIGLATRNQYSRMFRRFYPEASEALETQFCDLWEDAKAALSMAELQGYFLFYKDAPELAVSSVPEYICQRAAQTEQEREARDPLAARKPDTDSEVLAR